MILAYIYFAGVPALHDALAVAVDNGHMLLVWEEQVMIGAQRTIMVGPASPNASVMPKKLLDGGGEPSELSAAWNGTAWTIAVCNPAWGVDNDDAMLVWGELTTDGTFTRQGEHSFGAGAGSLHCSQLRIDNGTPYLYASVRDGDHCESRRFELVGRAPVIGPPRPVCRVWADAGGAVFGPDPTGKAAMIDREGEASRAAVTAESDVAGPTVVTRSQATIRFWTAPFKKPARTLTLPGTPIDLTGGAAVYAMRDGGVALVQAVYGKEPHYAAAWFDKRGKLVASDDFGGAPSLLLACTAAVDGLYCAYADDGVGKIHGAELTRP